MAWPTQRGPLVIGCRPARWASARSLGVGPLVGRWPARWASARSLGCRSARWAAARLLGRLPSICHSPRVEAPVCDIMLPPLPPPIGSTLSAPESVEIPLFTPSNGGLSTSVGASAAAAGATILRQPPAGEYTCTSSPSAELPARLFRRIVELEFVEMSELLPDSWQEETQPLVVFDAQLNPRLLSRKAPVQDIRAAVLVTRYPDKGPELWAYQASIVRAARNYEGLAWVAYDRQYRREALARKDLNWSATNSRLYNEAFTGRAKAIPRCRHCLSDSHITAHCTLDATLGTPTQVHPNAGSSSSEICRSYNAGRCQYVRCRYRHVCQECSYPHLWIQCPKNSSRGGTRSAENAFTVEEGSGSPLALRQYHVYMYRKVPRTSPPPSAPNVRP